jgi:uncharacterized iron-regulated membrane protein
MFRKALFWIHLLTGVIAGLVILIMSVTGVLLTYEKQIVSWADRRAASAAETGSAPLGPPLNVETLLTAVHTNGGSTLESPSNVTLRSGPAEPVTMNLGRETVLVNPTSGLVLAPQDAGVRQFFRKVTDWHRWLGVAAQANPDARANARAITGASNLMFLFLVVSGLYLWFPRKWRWQNVRAVLWFRGGLSGKARDFNWHNAAGFWCCVPLFFVVLSGVVISYPWASNLVYKAYGAEPPAQNRNKGKDGKGKEGRTKGAPAPVSTANLNALVAEAQRQNPDWKTIAFAPPTTDEAPVTFNIDTGTGGQPQKKSTLTLARTTAEVVRGEKFTDQEPARQTRSWMRFVHTGEYYGLTGQTIAGIASLGGALLVWTGLALAYRRFRAWLARDRRAPAPAEEKKETPVAA